MGIAFVKQYAQSGLDVPLFRPAFSFDQTILAAVGAAALGVKKTPQWSKVPPNPAHKAFVAAFQQAYAHRPSLISRQGSNTTTLILPPRHKAGREAQHEPF